MTTLQIKRNKDFFRSAFDNLLEGCQIIGFDWTYQYLNDSAVIHSHRSIEELLGKKYNEVWPGSENTDLFRIMQECMENRVPRNLENEFSYPDGTRGWFELRIQPVPVGIFILSVDITARKNAEKTLRESAENFKNFFDNSAVGKAWTTPDGKMKVNRAFCQILGYSEAELAEVRWQDITHPDDLERDQEFVSSIIAGEYSSLRWEKRYIHKNGSPVWVDISTSLQRDGSNKPLYFITSINDITERKYSEEALESQRSLLTALINSANDIIIFSLDKNHCYTAYNKAHREEMKHAWNAEIEIGLNMPDFIRNPECRQLVKQSLERALNGESFSEIQRQTDPETYFEYNWNPIIQHNEIIGVTVFAKNVTEGKQVEEALKESEEKFSAAFKSSPYAITITQPEDGHFIEVNDAFCRMTGYTREESLQNASIAMGLWVNTEDRVLVINKLLEGEKVEELESKFRKKNGEIITGLLSSQFIPVKNKTYIFSSINDITKRKEDEKAQKESDQLKSELLGRLNEAQHSALIGSWEWNMKENTVWWSDETYHIFGVSREDFIPGFEANGKFIHPDDLGLYSKSFEHSLQTGEPLNIDIRLTNGNGKLKFCRSQGQVVMDDSGQPLRFTGTIMDITSQKRADEALKQSELRYRSLLTNLEAGVVVHAPDTSIIMTNPKAAELLGLSEDQMKGKLAIDPRWMFLNENKKRVPLEEYPVNLVAKSRKPLKNLWLGVNRPETKDIAWLLVNGFPVFDEKGEIAEILISFIDITERKHAEEALRLKNLVFDTSLAANSIADLNGIITETNDAFLNIWGFPSREEVLGKPLSHFLCDQDQIAAIVTALNEKDIWEGEYQARRKNGSTFSVYSLATALKDENGQLIGYQSSVIDITERKNAEIKLQESESKFKNLVWDMPVGVILQGPNSEIILSNPKSLELLGLTEDQLLGKSSFAPDWNVIHEDGSPCPGIAHSITLAIDRRQPVCEAVMGILRPSADDRIWLQVDAEPKFNTDGTVRQVVCTIIDLTERKQAEKLQMLSELRYRRLFESAKDGILILNAETGMIEDVNPFLIKMLGYSREEFIEKAIWEIGFFSDIAANREKFQELQQNEYTRYDNLPLESADGNIQYVEFISNVYEEGDHKVIQCNIRDITERKLAEEALLESEQKFREAVANLDEGYYSVTIDGVLLEHNQAFCRMLGFDTFADLKGIHLPDFWQNPDERQDYIKELMNSGSVSGYQMLAKTRTGDKITILLSSHLVRDKNRKPLRIEGVFLDITGRIRDEEALHRQAQRLHTLHKVDKAILSAIETPEAIVENVLQHIQSLLSSQHASIGIIDKEKEALLIIDNKKKIVTHAGKKLIENVNKHLENLRQKKMEVVEDISKRTDIPELLRIFHSEEVSSCISLPLISGDKIIGAMNLGWKDSRSFTGEDLEIAGEVADQVTIALKQSQLQLESKQNAAELERRVEERTAQLLSITKEHEAFSYSVSHDLRSPLRAIHGFTQILMEDYAAKFDDEGKRICTIIRDNSLKMGQLIDDLLEFSRLNRIEKQHSDIDMNKMVKFIFRELTDTNSRQRIKIKIGPICNVHADATMIRQVWVNLLSNALKFSSKKETALISVTSESNKQTGKKTYCIKDNGVGFDMNYADKLFGVFQRLHSVKDFEGTGVGLAIVQRIIHRHGGEVWAQSKPNEGASFYFSLPEEIKK